MMSANVRLDASKRLRGPLLWWVLGAASVAHAGPPPVPDTFTATTAGMSPSGVDLKIIVRAWSDDAARMEVLAALGSDDARGALASLPTVGYVWHAGSAIGYAVKYAHRTTSADGERVTFVTDKLLGAYGLKPWTAETPPGATVLTYSVIELQLSGQGGGSGQLSLAADLQLDASGGVVSLAAKAGVPSLLTNAKLEPKPYWVEAH